MSVNYSGSKCPRCQSTSFEIAEETPSKSNFILSFVRCSLCKTVVGVNDFYNIGRLIHDLAKRLKIDLNR